MKNADPSAIRPGIERTTDMALLVLFLAVACVFAFANRFMMDDAYIGLRYARHFAENKGLVWYPGSREYGYTNFLFTVLEGLLMKGGFAAENAAFAISIPAYLFSIFLTFRIASTLHASLFVPAFCTLALTTHLTFSAYATGGLETSLQTCLVLSVYYVLILWRQTGKSETLWAMALGSAAALLTRLDSAFLLLPAYGGLAWGLANEVQCHRRSGSSGTIWLLALAGIPTLAVVGLLAFCGATYGQMLPNTFYAKVSIQRPGDWGIHYLAYYLRAQAGTPLMLLVWAAGCLLYTKRDAKRLATAFLLAAPIALWIVYILYIGGDFMEYRLLVPILPFFYLLTGGAILDVIASSKARVLLFATMCIGNFTQYRFLGGKVFFSQAGVSTALLDEWVTTGPINWAATGQALHAFFYTGNGSDVKIATDAAGAIPFYSDLPTIDEYGLNTRDVLTTGKKREFAPGHMRHAGADYLQAQQVNLIIDLPAYVCTKDESEICTHGSISPAFNGPRMMLKQLPIVLVPLEHDCYLMSYYLNRHPLIEELLRRGILIPFPNGEAEFGCGSREWVHTKDRWH